MYVGVDGCPGGWIAVAYSEGSYMDADHYGSIEGLWEAYEEKAESILIDVPIGLREDSNKPRPCDTAARKKLSPRRHNSVFPPPVRAAVHENSYEQAKATQEERTDGSLGVQSWGIAKQIAELDTFLRKTRPEAKEVICEAHPEVCFWALNGKQAMNYSKTGQPAAAFWERITVLEGIDSNILEGLRNASTDFNLKIRNDDVVDAFALAVTASPMTGSSRRLPDEWPDGDEGDPTGELPMKIRYAFPKNDPQ
mgnify:CR=1 FL=1